MNKVSVNVFFLSLAAALHLGAADSLVTMEWNVEGAMREALVYIPTVPAKTFPVVFVFHGHGGNMKNAAAGFSLHTLWPEAIVVYPQGLNTPGKLTDPEGKKPGWQNGTGIQNDRDLKFFDAMLSFLKEKYPVDEKRVYATGHSNGGGFTYLLWSARGSVFAAFAPMAAILAGEEDRNKMEPKPVFHAAGNNDPLVQYAWQEMMIKYVQEKNGCLKGEPWGDNDKCTMYASSKSAPVVTYIHSEGHKLAKEALPLIVRFFKEQSL